MNPLDREARRGGQERTREKPLETLRITLEEALELNRRDARQRPR